MADRDIIRLRPHPPVAALRAAVVASRVDDVSVAVLDMWVDVRTPVRPNALPVAVSTLMRGGTDTGMMFTGRPHDTALMFSLRLLSTAFEAVGANRSGCRGGGDAPVMTVKHNCMLVSGMRYFIEVPAFQVSACTAFNDISWVRDDLLDDDGSVTLVMRGDATAFLRRFVTAVADVGPPASAVHKNSPLSVYRLGDAPVPVSIRWPFLEFDVGEDDSRVADCRALARVMQRLEGTIFDRAQYELYIDTYSASMTLVLKWHTDDGHDTATLIMGIDNGVGVRPRP